MTETLRWTVRGVSLDTVERIAEVSEESGHTFGELLDEAVEVWFDALPFAGDDHEQRLAHID